MLTVPAQNDVPGFPAIRWRFSGDLGKVKPVAVQQQDTQIVQSCLTLDDFLP